MISPTARYLYCGASRELINSFINSIRLGFRAGEEKVDSGRTLNQRVRVKLVWPDSRSKLVTEGGVPLGKPTPVEDLSPFSPTFTPDDPAHSPSARWDFKFADHPVR
jgi:hypothetical protein